MDLDYLIENENHLACEHNLKPKANLLTVIGYVQSEILHVPEVSHCPK
jgi:hypothetical protein